MKKPLYRFIVPQLLLLAATVQAFAYASGSSLAIVPVAVLTSTATDTIPTVTPPSITPAPGPVYENNILFGISNPNESSWTEVYRSLSATDGFTLVYTTDIGENAFYDADLKPRTTYFYKLRAVVDGPYYSEFSGVSSFTTGSKYYPPLLSADAVNAASVEVTLTDRTFDDISYEILRIVEGSGEAPFVRTIQLPDSGQVYSYIDEQLSPGTTYFYWVNVYVKGPGNPVYEGAATATVTTPAGPFIEAFMLIDPFTDQEISDLPEGASISAAGRPNISAIGVGDAGSVVFYLNGRRHCDTTAPFSLFGDHNGNYRPGRLRPGNYTLIATPYSGTCGEGTEGPMLTVHFTVEEPAAQDLIAAEINHETISFFPNPVTTQSVLAIKGEPHSPMRVQVLDPIGSTSSTLFDGTLDDKGNFTLPVDAHNLRKGIHVLAITLNDRIITRRIVVK